MDRVRAVNPVQMLDSEAMAVWDEARKILERSSK